MKGKRIEHKFLSKSGLKVQKSETNGGGGAGKYVQYSEIESEGNTLPNLRAPLPTERC
jgi:hypothetical protein